MEQKQEPGSNPPSATFDINEGVVAGKGIILPSLPTNIAATDIEGYARSIEILLGGSENPILVAARALGAEKPTYTVTKAGAKAPSKGAFTYGRMSYMPDTAVNGGVIQWPGINPDSLRKIARENVAPQLIIGMRVDDVIRYSQWSNQLWRPGWCIEPFDPNEKIKGGTKKEIQEAVRFLCNSCIDSDYTKSRERDSRNLTNFQRFLSAMVRDSLTYDMIAVWTDIDGQDRVKQYALLPASNIRYCTKEGYNGNPDLYAVAVDDGGRVVEAFTRDQLTTYVRNIRTDADIWGYGWPEIEIGMRVIKGFQNALDLNIDIFDRSAIANGILTISGGAVTQRQLDLLNRLITNMKKGITKAWALPVIGLQGDSKLEIVDLTKLKDSEGYYKEFMNMLAGALATLWRFPVRRLGYKISGSHKDNEPAPDGSMSLVDEDDPGLAPLLQHLETIINEYLLWTRWPHLRFRFTGKNPKEDSREYEARSLARTWGERRQEAGLPTLPDLVKINSKLKKLMEDSEGDEDEDGDSDEDGDKKPDSSKDESGSKSPIGKTKIRIKVRTGAAAKDDEKDDKGSEGEEGDSESAMPEEEEEDEGEEFEKQLLKLAHVMELAPIDPNLSTVFQAIASKMVAESGGDGADKAGQMPMPGQEMTSKKDPAKSESHGHQSGVRRDSKAEKKK